ncbi:hypothetical protein M4I32_11670 [Microbacterium sp. LRZ72]|uniref:lipopolysaccharide biosynthesis protein n=1 Tax=Microbacterium sp. LRZ72 TaxID=2942481 RepID=UPI0029BBBF34|nr:hypothetical protein [Microbacterium sp. LRZ72]MDX2377458.1 hypothetical protein [Microbacterium sp. LRZ72]
MRSALLSTGARVVTMAVSLVCGVLTARLILGQAGVDYYALFSLLVAVPGLIAFSDLGAGAVVVNSIASSRDVRNDALLARQAVTVMRVQLMFAASLTAVNLLLLLTGGWNLVLGSAAVVPGADLAAFACLCLFALTICLGIWQRVLLGLGRNPLVILLQGIVSPLSLLLVWIMLGTDDERIKSLLALASFTATLVAAILGFVVASRYSGALLPRAARRLARPRRHPGAQVMDVGWPMLAQLLSTPLAMVLPRFILAQFATALAVAQYGVAGQVFFALQALVAAAGVTLWPAFTRARSRGELRAGPGLISVAFAAGLAATTAVILAIGPWLFGLISNDELTIGPELILAFGAMVTVQAALYPLGMFIMDKRGIRFQVAPALLMAASTVSLTILFVPSLGVLAPPLANAVSVVVFQLVPYAWYIRRHRRRLYGDEA